MPRPPRDPSAPPPTAAPFVDGVELRAIAEALSGAAEVPGPSSVRLDAPGGGRPFDANAMTVSEHAVERGAVARAKRARGVFEALPAELQPVASWVAQAPLHPGVHVWPLELARTLGPRAVADAEARAIVDGETARRERRVAATKRGGGGGNPRCDMFAGRIEGARIRAAVAREKLEAWGADRLAALVDAWRAMRPPRSASRGS